MAREPAVADVVEEIYQSILASPKRQRRLRSKTFWGKFGFERRTKERVERVKEALQERDVILNIDEVVFGTEGREAWIVLTYVEPSAGTPGGHSPAAVPAPPSSSWFALMKQRVFESEREVEYYFVVPFLEQLGYEEDDFAIGYPVQMYEGVKRVNKEADFAIFDGLSRSKEDALLVVEVKKSGRVLREDAVGQARAYAMWLNTPYYVVTNADEIQVFLFRGATLPDVKLMHLKRGDLDTQWAALYERINKAAVIEHKQKLRRAFAADGI